MAHQGFADYVTATKALLDPAFRMVLEELLEGSLSGDASFLVSTLMEGKKIRGCLTCLVGEALGADRARLIPRAVAVEMIQAATLIHDDFVDQDTTRRGKPAVWTMEGARKAVLLGDVIFAGAIRLMSETSREDGLAVARAIAMISVGALHEPLGMADLSVLLPDSDSDRDGLYEKIVRLKTGVLFSTACELGAIAAQATPDVEEGARRYGLKIGSAYQIADDLKDISSLPSDGGLGLDRLMAIAPALLHFVPEHRRTVFRLLEGGQGESGDGASELFALIEGSMEREIAKLLASAASEIEALFPANDASRLAKEAPWGTIGLFKEG